MSVTKETFLFVYLRNYSHKMRRCSLLALNPTNTRSCDTCYPIGCVEKLKYTKSNYGYSYFIAPWYIETEKNMIF